MGLNESYAQIRAQILMLDPLPNINKVFALVVQEERQRRIGSGNSSMTESMVFGTSSASPSVSAASNVKSKRDRPVCTHCGISGHTFDKCYKLHGYPPGYRFKSKTAQSKTYVNQASLSSNATDTFSQAATSTPEISSMNTLTPSQCQQLINLLSTQLNHGASLGDSDLVGPFVSHFTGIASFSSQIHSNSILVFFFKRQENL